MRTQVRTQLRSWGKKVGYRLTFVPAHFGLQVVDDLLLLLEIRVRLVQLLPGATTEEEHMLAPL